MGKSGSVYDPLVVCTECLLGSETSRDTVSCSDQIPTECVINPQSQTEVKWAIECWLLLLLFNFIVPSDLKVVRLNGRKLENNRNTLEWTELHNRQAFFLCFLSL